MDGMILLDLLADKSKTGCYGQGRCGKCRVRLVDGPEVEPSAVDRRHLSPSQLKAGWILACQHRFQQGMVIEAPSIAQRKKKEKWLAAARLNILVQPAVTKVAVDLPMPSAEDCLPDLERVLTYLGVEKQNVSRSLLISLPGILRENNFEVSVVMLEEQLTELESNGEQLIAVEPGDTTSEKYGIAFDFGTNTVVGWLADLNSGEILAVSALTNSQMKYGREVMARISHVASLNGLNELRREGLDLCNEIVCQLLAEANVSWQQIYETVIVGNTVMAHLLLGIDPSYLGTSPFIPAVGSAMSLAAADFGLDVLPTSKVFFLPSIAGFTGSDAVGFMVAAGLDSQAGVCVGIDIGTDTEIIIAAPERLLACSTPTGSAFAGIKIKCGMRAETGAIDLVEIIDNKVYIHVLDKVGPRGICAPGLMSAMTALLKTGVINQAGIFAKPEDVSEPLRKHLQKDAGGWKFVLVSADESVTGNDIAITYQDIREVQMAKSAVRASINILLNELGLSEQDIDKVTLTGAFGVLFDFTHILALGLLPESCRGKITFMHNAAGTGARLALLSQSARQKALLLAHKVQHIEMSSHPDFRGEFVKYLEFAAP
ncbi:MAG: ASKHA domain-containing protein [Pelosinus sp.]|nr:ASKHA domain-containing protein [Pelosinus sp.]